MFTTAFSTSSGIGFGLRARPATLVFRDRLAIPTRRRRSPTPTGPPSAARSSLRRSSCGSPRASRSFSTSRPPFFLESGWRSSTRRSPGRAASTSFFNSRISRSREIGSALARWPRPLRRRPGTHPAIDTASAPRPRTAEPTSPPALPDAAASTPPPAAARTVKSDRLPIEKLLSGIEHLYSTRKKPHSRRFPLTPSYTTRRTPRTSPRCFEARTCHLPQAWVSHLDPVRPKKPAEL